MIWLLLALLAMGGVTFVLRTYVFKYVRLRDVPSLGRLAWDAEKHLRWIYEGE